MKEKKLPRYDKMGQLRWLLNAIRDRCKRAWKLAKFVIIEEMMIRYKRSYCPSRKYMPNKP